MKFLVMKNQIVEDYLSKQHKTLDETILSLIKNELTIAQKEQNEDAANYYWFFKQVYLIQRAFIGAFDLLTKGKYEDSWKEYDRADIAIGYLIDNTPNGIDNQAYNIAFIGKMIPQYQILFPYRIFLSREAIIKEEKCSICGQTIKLRNHCNHKSGKVYMGELCLRKVTDMELKAFALVSDPFDKYTIIHIEGKEYNYGMLRHLLKIIHDPFEDFHVVIDKEKKDEYKNAKKNDPCPCSSGKKYKKCHLGSKDELFDHYIICVNKSLSNMDTKIQLFNTWIN